MDNISHKGNSKHSYTPPFKCHHILYDVSTFQLYCKSTNFGVLLYLANLANCVISPIFVAANTYVDRCIDGPRRDAKNSRQINVNRFILRNAKFYSRQNLLIYSKSINVMITLLRHKNSIYVPVIF